MGANPKQLPGQNLGGGIWIYNLLQFISKHRIPIQTCFHLIPKRRNKNKAMDGKQRRVNAG